MISSLTTEQQAKIQEYYSFYLKKGLSTQPANRSVAEKAVKEMYKLIKEKEPKCIWVNSPTELITRTKNLSLDSSLYSSLYLSLDSSLDSSLRSSLDSSLRSSLRSSLDSSLYSSLYLSLRSSLDSSLRSSLDSSLRSSLRSSLYSSLLWGQFNSSWISFFKYCNEVLDIQYQDKEVEKLNLWVGMMEVSFFFVFKGLTILMEHPKELKVDGKGSTHCTTGYAVTFQDGTGIYVVHGNNLTEEEFNDCDKLYKEKRIDNLEYIEMKARQRALV
jgi:hypothetical protein